MLRVGFFKNFKPADTLLFWGDNCGLDQLASFLCEFAGDSRPEDCVHNPPWISEDAGFEVLLTISSRSAITITEHRAEWLATREDLADHAERVLALSASDIPAHEYLDALGMPPGIQIMVSLNEYPPNLGERPVTPPARTA